MAVHVFVATTQGLVAIQSIIPFDDKDIMSVVSINGTSTIANISSAYHNFVQRGCGLIAQEFGNENYRVNISDKIDQGSSWQLGFYVAHLAFQANMLGNGDVKANDTVICATGEINTSEKTALPIDKLSLKQKLATHSMATWANNQCDVCLMVPQENMKEINAEFPHKVIAINKLCEIPALMPKLEHNFPLSLAKPVRSSLAKYHQKDSHLKIIIGATLIILIAVLMLVNSDFIGDSGNDTANILAKNSPNSIITHSFINAEYSGENECEEIDNITKLPITGNQILSASLANLCQLTFVDQRDFSQVWLIAIDSGAVIALAKNSTGWRIPLPTKQQVDRSYLLLAIAPSKGSMLSLSSDLAIKESLLRWTKTNKVSAAAANNWLASQSIEGEVYLHKLLSY